MSQKKTNLKTRTKEKLAKVKLALAEKYERLAKTVKSIPRRKSMKNHAARFRRQAADLLRK